MELNSHSELVRLKNYIIANYPAKLTANGLDTIDNYRVGHPIKEGYSRTLGVYVHPMMGIDFDGDEFERTDCDLAVGRIAIVVGLLLDPSDDDGGITGEDSKLYKYADLLIRVLGAYLPSRNGTLVDGSPQHSMDTSRPDVYFRMEIDVEYEETT